MGNAAGSAEQPAGPAAPAPKQPAAPKQPMPAAGELEERFNRVLVSLTCHAPGAGGVGGGGGGGGRSSARVPRPPGAQVPLRDPLPGGCPPRGGTDRGFFP